MALHDSCKLALDKLLMLSSYLFSVQVGAEDGHVYCKSRTLATPGLTKSIRPSAELGH